MGVFGPLESVRVEHDKGEAFVAFVDAQAAAMLLQERTTILFHGQAADLSWAKAKPLSHRLANAVSHGATRNLYIGNVPPGTDQAQLFAAFSVHGNIESVRVMPS